MVKKFRFRLERVLQYRQMVKDERIKALLEKNAELHEANKKLEELQAAVLMNKVAENATLAAHEIELVAQYSQRLREQIEHQNKTVAEAENAVLEARDNYISASKDSESLEKLKNRKHDEYEDYLLKEEGKFLDELSTQRIGYQNRSKE